MQDVPPRLLYVVSEDWYFLAHRLPMARAARDAGYEVHVCHPGCRRGPGHRGGRFQVTSDTVQARPRGTIFSAEHNVHVASSAS